MSHSWKFSLSCRTALLVEAALVSVVHVSSAQAIVTSKDAYLRHEGNAWTLGTSSFEKKLILRDGQLVTTFLRNKVSRHKYQGKQAPSEIRFRADGQDVGTPPWSWRTENSRSRQLPQGELQLDLELQGGPLAITKHYVVYPGTALVREWLTVRNRSRAPVRISQLRFLNTIGMDASASPLRLHYITGGGNFNGSQLLKTEALAAGYRRIFDSYRGIQKESYSGYLPLIVLEDARSGNGLAVGWDYLGHWSFEASCDRGGPAEISLQVAGYDKELPPGSAIDTPRAFVATSSGDLDKLGNQLLDWQYEYLWDFTNPEYFAKTRWAVDWPNPWVGRGGTPSADNWGRRLALDLRYVDLMRESGGDILWDEAGWYDSWGTWNGPDWARTTAYLRKHGMRWVLWYPTFLAIPESKISQLHPDWLIHSEQAFEQSIPATADWQKKLLDGGVDRWGDFQWRYDIAPAVSANDSDYLASDQNFRGLLQQFKSTHPKSGIDACYGGGRWISYDLARLAESGEYTDGGVGPYSGYYTSLLVPPDKLHNVADFDHTYYVGESDHVHLGMNPTWYRDPGDGSNLEDIRKDWDLFHYLVSQGVVGRWSHVFRPRVENDDPIWYVQRMDRSGSKGVILTKHAKTGPSYFLISKPVANTSNDKVRGGPTDMTGIVTSDAATPDTGIYEDPTDGGYGYYGVPGEVFGPLTFQYQSERGEQPYVTSIYKPGASRSVETHFFGMAVQMKLQGLTITKLGQFDPGKNQGIYLLSLVRAEDKAVVASAKLDMARTHVDALGFKYAELSNPAKFDEAPMKPVVISPRGLIPDQLYDVRTYRSRLVMKKSGSELMTHGISLAPVLPGELVFLNLSNYPGSGIDTSAPRPPTNITSRRASNLGKQGIEVAWSAATDNNWISYYEVLKNGTVVGKAAKGTLFFDHTSGARNDVAAEYKVRTVDGDGNRSSATRAQVVAGEPETFEPLGDFGPTQGANQWNYEQSFGNGRYGNLTWDSGGYEGRWLGSGLGRIGRIWMQPAADADLSRTFVSPATGRLTLSGQVEKDPSAPSGASVYVRILCNSGQIWPVSGWSSVPPYGAPLHYDLKPFAVQQGEPIRFLVKHNGQNRSDPIIWDPVISIQRGN